MNNTVARDLIERELDQLARQHRSPEAFEALFRIIWLADLIPDPS